MVEKTKANNCPDFSANSKPVLILFFLAVAICLSCCFAAAGKSKITLLSATVDNVKPVKTSDTKNLNQWQTVKMRVTAYCPCPKCCGSSSDGVTASGHEISEGDRFVAADKTYPFGTEMNIPGYKNAQAVKVLDRGGAIQGNKLDVFFNSHQEALEWGVKELDVKIRYQ